MYVYLQCRSGFNNILCTINKSLLYCKEYNRTLLLDTFHSHYNINFSDYFSFPNDNIICDLNEIKKICSIEHTVYPEILNTKMLDILRWKCSFSFSRDGIVTYENTVLSLPKEERKETIIVYIGSGGGDSYDLFQKIRINPIIKNLCEERYNKLLKPYLCIQVRNTDYACDYQKLYNENKDLINSFNCIYIATDDESVIEFFKSQNLPIFNFISFNSNSKYKNLHYNNSINPHIKITDLMSDIYIIAMSNKLLSNSNGGFINLVKKLYNNKNKFLEQFE